MPEPRSAATRRTSGVKANVWIRAVIGVAAGIGLLGGMAYGLASYQTTEDLHLERTVDEAGVVHYRVQPKRLAWRTALTLDGEEHKQVEIDPQTAGPGRHVVYAAIERRGGRFREVSQVVVGGPFQARGQEGAAECGLALAVSAEAIDDLLRPMIEGKLLDAVRDNDYFGPTSTIESAKFELFNQSIHFSVTVAGDNRLLVEGWLYVRATGARNLEVKLIRLSDVEFEGKLRKRANAAGAAVGSTLGPIGAVVGYVAVDRFVSKKARETVKKELVDGLEDLSDLQLVPPRVELVPGEPRSAVELGFCQDTDAIVVDERGVSAAFYAEPLDWGPAPVDPGDGVVEGAPDFGSRLEPEPLDSVDDIHLDVTLGQINRVVDAWQANGLIQDVVDAQGWAEQVDEQLRAWTQLRLVSLDVRRAPFAGPSRAAASDLDSVVFPYTVANVRLGLEGPTTQDWTDIELSVLGDLEAGYDSEADSVILRGSLDDLVLSCTNGGELWPCYAELLSLSEAQRRVDEQLRAADSLLPTLSVRQMLLERTDGVWDLEDLQVHATGDFSDVVRLRASLR